jgi:hypothetical protein
MSEVEARIAALRTRLAGLREEFARHPTLSAEGRTRFAALSAELERQLHAASAARTAGNAPAPAGSNPAGSNPTGSNPAGSNPAGGHHGSRFEGLAVEFEAAHPDVAASLRQLVDLLGRAGL